MEKELILAIEFKKAPIDLQTAAITHYANVKAVTQLKRRLTNIASELEQAERKSEESAKALRIGLKAWEPEV
jgi:hypothetical protein